MKTFVKRNKIYFRKYLDLRSFAEGSFVFVRRKLTESYSFSLAPKGIPMPSRTLRQGFRFARHFYGSL